MTVFVVLDWIHAVSEVQTRSFSGRGLNKVVTHAVPHFQRRRVCVAERM